MKTLRYSARTGSCSVLGPGNRAVLWVHGCCFSCEGCIGEKYKNGPWTETSPQEAASWYLEQNADGLTVSGGEPMLQADALSEMIDRVRAERDCGLIVYTGFVYENLLARVDKEPGAGHFLSQIDLLIDGPYIRDLDYNQPYRGSENQRFLLLTERYREELASYYQAAESRRVEIRLSERGTLLAGVPGKEQAAIWRQIRKLGEEHER